MYYYCKILNAYWTGFFGSGFPFTSAFQDISQETICGGLKQHFCSGIA